MYLLDTRYLHRLPDRIDDADVATRADDDETFVFKIEASRVLMDVLIGHNLAFHFGGQVMTRVASGAVLEFEFYHSIWKHLLDAAALDLACRERLLADDDG